MFRNATKTTITEVADFLEQKHQAKEPVAMLLGTRAGGLFNNEELYKQVSGYSLPEFGKLSIIERFDECYRILSDASRFSERNIYDIFKAALNSIPLYRKEDDLLAGLVQEGFFDFIVTTNFDALLENAFARKNLSLPSDYRVIVPEINDSAGIFHDKPMYVSLLKVFGDLERLHYRTVGNPFDLDADDLLKGSLARILANDVLMIGYDHIWDGVLERALPRRGKSIWYINHELPEAESHLVEVLENRQGKYLVGLQGSYGDFLRSIYGYVSSAAADTTPLPALPAAASTNQVNARKKAFISYSHRDKHHLERFKKHLKWYMRKGLTEKNLDIWDDSKIDSGANWNQEIKKALAETSIAVLLVSVEFLSSDFILDYELSPLLEAAKNGEVKILQVLLGPCAFHHTPLYAYQAENGAQPLSDATEHQQDLIWAGLAEKLYKLLTDVN